MRKNITFGQWMLHGIFAPIDNKNIRWACTVAGMAVSVFMMVKAERRSVICLHGDPDNGSYLDHRNLCGSCGTTVSQ